MSGSAPRGREAPQSDGASSALRQERARRQQIMPTSSGGTVIAPTQTSHEGDAQFGEGPMMTERRMCVTRTLPATILAAVILVAGINMQGHAQTPAQIQAQRQQQAEQLRQQQIQAQQAERQRQQQIQAQQAERQRQLQIQAQQVE